MYKIVRKVSTILFLVGLVLTIMAYYLARYEVGESLGYSLGFSACAFVICIMAVLGNYEVKHEISSRE